MKKLQLPGAMLGLTVLLTACPSSTGQGPQPPATSTYSLTVKVEGVAGAPVTVTNTSTNTPVYSGTVEGSKTFGGLKAGSVLKVEGGAVNGYAAPAAQTVTLSGDRVAALSYTRTGNAVSDTRIAGPVVGNTLKLNNVYLDTSVQPFFGKGNVDGSNTLTLDLAGQVPAQDFYPIFAGCAATGANTNPDVLIWNDLELSAYGSQGDLLGHITEKVVSGTGSNLPNAQVLRLYAKADARFQGTCTSGEFSDDIDVTLKAGWNALVLAHSGNAYTLRNVGADTRTALTFRAAEAKVVVGLQPSELIFNTDGPVTAEATLIQVGGYSGPVKLRTDDPNLTVEPDTLTLPALAAQGLSARRGLHALQLGEQSVTTSLKFRYLGTDNASRPFELQVLDAGGQLVGGGNGLLNVQRPGIFLYTTASGLQVTPNSSVGLSAYVNSVSGFSGNVTVRVEGLPAGVTASSATVTLGSNSSATANLTVTGGASLTPGEYEATLIAEGSGRSARSTVKIVIPKPSVNVSVANAYAPVAVYAGETGSVRVNVYSNYGFSGSTTLTLTDLPAGVTSAPKTVEVAPNATTTVDLPLTVTAEATPGTSTVKVISPDSASWGSANVFQLEVRPERTLIGGGISALAPAQTGVWVVTTNDYDAASGAYRLALRRYVNGQAVTTVDLTDVDSKLLALPSGDVLVFSGYDGSRVMRVNDAGTVTPVSAPTGLENGAADSLGRIWYVHRTSSEVGGMQTTLERWDPATNTTAVIDSSRDYGYSSGQFVASNSGAFLAYRSNSSNKAVLIDAATGTLTDLTLSDSGQDGLALSDAGQVWYATYSQLVRINTDGSSTSFDLPSLSSLIGFDRANPQVLWALSYNGVRRIDTSAATPAVATFITGSPHRGTTLRNGGVAVGTSEYENGRAHSSLSILK